MAAGSSGTASARARKRRGGKTGEKANITKLVDVNLLKVQFTGKLQPQYKFCKESAKLALQQAQEFRNSTSWLFKQFDELVSQGIKEAAWPRGRFSLIGMCRHFLFPVIVVIMLCVK